MAKKEERLGRGRKKDDRGLIVLWITVSGKRKFRLVAYLSICQQQKQLSPKGVQFSRRLFAAHGEQTRSVNCTPVSKRSSDYILSQNMSSFRTVVFLVREDERTIYR